MQPGCAMHKAKALHKYLERQNLEEVIICILLDWHYPWTWLRTLRFWIRSITGIIESLKSSKSNQDFVIENGIKALETRIRAYTESAKMESITALQHDPSLARPLGKGEFDRPIGLPIMCVAQNVRAL